MAPPKNRYLGRGRYARGRPDGSERVSANPDALRTYSTDGPDLTAAVRTLVGELDVVLESYRSGAQLTDASLRFREFDWESGWMDANGSGAGICDALSGLCDDFDHLDGFVGSVADAFFAADGLSDPDADADRVLTLTVADIEAHGIGFANREESIAEGERLAQEYQGFDEATTVAELEAWGNEVAVIQNDTAAAVALIEGMGADGLEQLPELANGDVPDVVTGVVGVSLETALDTLPRDEPWEHTDPAHADLPREHALDPGIHVGLLGNADALVPYTTTATPNINRVLGQADARFIDGLIDAAGDGTLSNATLIGLYHDLEPIMGRPEHLHGDDAYTVSMLNDLGPENADYMVHLANSFGLVHPHMDEAATEVYDGYVVPFSSIVSTAELSGLLDQNVYDAIFDPEALRGIPDRRDPSEAGPRRGRALLLHEGDFSPQATADLAAVAIAGSGSRAWRSREGFTTTEFLTSRPELEPLADNAWAAYNALAQNPEASFLYFSDSSSNISDVTRGWPVDTYLVGAVDAVSDRLDRDEDDVRGAMQWAAADALYSGLHDYPILADAHDDPEVTATVTQAIRLTGNGGAGNVDLPDPVRIRMAEISTPYSADIAIAGERSALDAFGGMEDFDRLEGLTPDEVDRFFQMVIKDDTAAVIISRNSAALTEAMTHIAVENGYHDTAMRVAGVYSMHVGQALNANHYSEVERAEVAYAGQRVWTDMTVDIVANGVTSLPHIRGPAATPPGRAMVSHFQGEARDALADVVIGETEVPDRDHIRSWYHTTRNSMNLSIGRALFENDEAREQLVEAEEANGYIVRADLDLESFMGLGQVSNRVNGLLRDASVEFNDQVLPEER